MEKYAEPDGWWRACSLTVEGDGPAGGSERNAFFATGNGGGVFTVSDGQSGASISAGSGCTKTAETTVRCTGVTATIAVSTGAGDDAVRLRSTNLESTIRGGDGNDLLIGSSTARDLIIGDAGNDCES